MHIDLPEPDAEIVVRSEDRDGREVDPEDADANERTARIVVELIRLPGREVVARASVAAPPNRSGHQVEKLLNKATDRLIKVANQEGLWW